MITTLTNLIKVKTVFPCSQRMLRTRQKQKRNRKLRKSQVQVEGKQCQKTMFSLKIVQSRTLAPPLPLRNVLSRDDSDNCPEVSEKESFEKAPEKNDVDNGGVAGCVDSAHQVVGDNQQHHQQADTDVIYHYPVLPPLSAAAPPGGDGDQLRQLRHCQSQFDLQWQQFREAERRSSLPPADRDQGDTEEQIRYDHYLKVRLPS